MKHTATMALMLNLGVAGVYAQQIPVKMTFSGNGAPSAIDLKQPNTNTSEENLAGNGTLGPFTFRLSRRAQLLRNRPALARARPSSIFQMWPAPACFASWTGVC